MRTLLALTLLLSMGCPGDAQDKASADPDSGPRATPHAPTPSDQDGDGWPRRQDCDDQDAAIHPDADERCNALDDDCDGEIDEDLAEFRCYQDLDWDDWGNAGVEIEPSCDPACGNRGASVVGDCADRGNDIHPGATEVCDSIDDDCDGEIDEGFETATAWPDEDGDGYGDTDGAERRCAEDPGEGWVLYDGDCDDEDPLLHPGAETSCVDGRDTDCDGLVDCEDEDCDDATRCAEGDCADGLDADRDGDEDCEDDECWGGPACPTVVTARVLRGARASAKRTFSFDARRDSCMPDSAFWERTHRLSAGTAASVEGTARVYRPGEATANVCAWGVRSTKMSRATRSSWDRTDGTHVRIVEASDRTGFWVSGDCGLSTSGFLPRAEGLLGDWFDWYRPERTFWTTDFTTSFSSTGCWYAHSATSDFTAYGSPVLWGDRYTWNTSTHGPL